ncbi:MAG: hypothetical protein L6437_12060 [Kiritimatiellae bacterium]|nr:hypothetical protein [Kiritimatiellia bacterium]
MALVSHDKGVGLRLAGQERHQCIRATVSLVILFAAFSCLSAPAETNAVVERPKDVRDSSWTFLAHELTLPAGKTAGWVPKDCGRLYKVVEDKEAVGGKALQVFSNQRTLRKMSIPVLATLPIDCPVGTYKVTVRMKLSGMLGIIGTPIQFSARQVAPSGRRDYFDNFARRMSMPAVPPNWDTATLHGYHFKQEDVYEEFSFLTEVIEPDDVSKRPIRPPARNGAGTLFSKAEIEAWKQGKGFPWEQKPLPVLSAAGAELVKQHRGQFVVAMNLLRAIPSAQGTGIGLGFVANSIRSLTVDRLRIERVPEPTNIVVRQVLPRKLWVRPGSDQTFAVWLHNRSGTPQKGTVRVRVVHGIDREIPVGEKDVSLENGTYTVVDFPWQPPEGQPLWGCAAVAELVRDGKVVASESDMFAVHSNVWAVRNDGGANRFANPYYRLPRYVNITDWYGSTPGDAIKPFPDDPTKPYLCGMLTFAFASFDSFKIVAEANRKSGVGSFLYMQPACGTGTYMEDTYLKHPEWFSGPLAWTDQYHDGWERVEKLLRETWEAGKPLNIPKSTNVHIEGAVNHAVPEVFSNMLSGVIKALEYAGFDGVRWDASPAPVRHSEYMGIKYGPETPEELSALLAQRIGEIKAGVRARMPNYTESANWGPPQYVIDRKATRPAEKDPGDQAFAAFLADGSSLMDEGWMSAGGRFDCRNVIRDYFWAACQETQFVRKFGGFWYSFSPGRDCNPYFTQSIIHYGLLVVLGGGSYWGPAACPAWSETGLAHFSMRYCEFLHDPKLQPVPDAATRIRLLAPQEIWYEDSAVWRDLPDGRRRYVIPIVNPPTLERFFLKDRFSGLPEPFREPFGVEMDVPPGFAAAKVWTLTAEPQTAAAVLPSILNGGVLRFDVPDLFTFRVLVIEFEKSKGGKG